MKVDVHRPTRIRAARRVIAGSRLLIVAALLHHAVQRQWTE